MANRLDIWADTIVITSIHAWIGDAIGVGLEKSLKAGC
jgi:hypothetical protein